MLYLVVALMVLPAVAGAQAASTHPTTAAYLPPVPWGGLGVGDSGATGANLSPVLSVSNGVNWTIPPTFWGANVRVYYPLGPAQTDAFADRPLNFVRWPGGATADEYNYTSNRVYQDDGTSYVPPSNESQFIGWCRAVGCSAIFQLPAEIDDPATAAYYVHYTIATLHFHPAYWEIGNEPALWTHFGIPWSLWRSSQNVNATPGSYAVTVQAYAKAIRAVDPSARLIGLPGVGTGGYGEASWITATVRLNGPNLSAVGIHVYPAGGATPGSNVSGASFLDTLYGPGSLPYRVPRDRAAILAACPNCTNLPLFVTELGSGTNGGPYQSYMAAFPQVPYIAAELAQAIQLEVMNVDLYALQANYSGSLLNTSTAPTVTEALYAELLSQLQPEVLNYSISRAVPTLFLVPTRNAAGTEYSLLAVDVNDTHSVRVSFGGTGFPILSAGFMWMWGGGSLGPSQSIWLAGAGPSSFVLPARSVALVEVV
jgi:hypothetical protein